MSDQAPQPQEEQQETAAMVPVDREDVEEALLRAIQVAAEMAATADDARDMAECSRAALEFAQAVVILDPALVAPQGVPPDALHPPVPQIQEQQGGN